MSKSKRRTLGEEPLGKRGVSPNRYLMSKRRASGEDPYGWIEGKEGKKAGRVKKAKPVKLRPSFKLKVKKIVGKPKLPKVIRNKLKKIEKGAVLLPGEIIAAARATGKVTGKITTDLSKTIASGVVTGPREANKVIRRVRVKIKAVALRKRLEHLFSVLGRECYRLIGKKKPVLKEKRIQELIKQIKEYQKELQSMERAV